MLQCIANNKSTKSANSNDFWRITWHLRLELWCWKFSFDITRMNYFLK